MSNFSGKDLPKMYSRTAIVEEARDMLALAAGPLRLGDTQQRGIERAARALGIPFSRAANIWQRKARLIEAAEFLNMKARIAELRERQAKQREQADEVRAKLAGLAADRGLVGGSGGRSGADLMGRSDNDLG